MVGKPPHLNLVIPVRVDDGTKSMQRATLTIIHFILTRAEKCYDRFIIQHPTDLPLHLRFDRYTVAAETVPEAVRRYVALGGKIYDVKKTTMV